MLMVVKRVSVQKLRTIMPQTFHKPTRLPSLASFFAIADGLGITPEELIAAMRKEAEVREKSNGERAENDE